MGALRKSSEYRPGMEEASGPEAAHRKCSRELRRSKARSVAYQVFTRLRPSGYCPTRVGTYLTVLLNQANERSPRQSPSQPTHAQNASGFVAGRKAEKMGVSISEHSCLFTKVKPLFYRRADRLHLLVLIKKKSASLLLAVL